LGRFLNIQAAVRGLALSDLGIFLILSRGCRGIFYPPAPQSPSMNEVALRRWGVNCCRRGLHRAYA